MSAFLVIFVVIIVVPLAIIAWVVGEVRSGIEGKAIFRGVIPEVRAKFFQETFGLNVEEMKQFHFDGCSFHFNEGVAYWDLSSVSCVEARDVTVINSELPHSVSWAHERVNGGPDRRYSSNPMTRTSRRFQLLFVGAKEHRLVTYGRPYFSKVDDALEKFNKLFAVSHAIDVEAFFMEYSEAFHKTQQTRQLLDEIKSKRAKVDSALSASRRLAFQKPMISGSLAPQQNDMVNEIHQFDLGATQLQQEIVAAQGTMKKVVQAVQTQISIYKDVQTMQSYLASKPAGKNSRQLQV